MGRRNASAEASPLRQQFKRACRAVRRRRRGEAWTALFLRVSCSVFVPSRFNRPDQTLRPEEGGRETAVKPRGASGGRLAGDGLAGADLSLQATCVGQTLPHIFVVGNWELAPTFFSFPLAPFLSPPCLSFLLFSSFPLSLTKKRKASRAR